MVALDFGGERFGLVAVDVLGLEPVEGQRRLAVRRITVASNGVGGTPRDRQASGLRQVSRASVSELATDAEIGM